MRGCGTDCYRRCRSARSGSWAGSGRWRAAGRSWRRWDRG
uniref:Uncharacterized protein n=1 Tax=Arundo donax TaxID=35708 RepID=A0A0A9TDX1_ARUDO